MTLVRLLRGGQVTLPVDVRQKLKLAPGDWLEAEMVERGVLLKPVSNGGRQQALEQMSAAKARVRPTPEQARKSQSRPGKVPKSRSERSATR